MLNNINVRNLLLLVLLVSACFMYALSENHINRIKRENSEIFSGDVKASSFKIECPDGLTVDQECDENISFSTKDQSIMEQREAVIGVWNEINTVCFYLSVILASILTYSLWSSSKDKKIKRGDYDVLH